MLPVAKKKSVAYNSFGLIFVSFLFLVAPKAPILVKFVVGYATPANLISNHRSNFPK
jgi:hypothetical protein